MESHFQTCRGGEGQAGTPESNWKVSIDESAVGGSLGGGWEREICQVKGGS